MRQLIVLFIVIISLFANPVNASIPTDNNVITTSCLQKVFVKEIEATCKVPVKNEYQEARQGCCSWHQGVCGCSAGRSVCCDGSYSPTCGC